MSEGIIIALIGFAGVVIAAIVSRANTSKKNKPTNEIRIRQKAEGDNSTVVGIQINSNTEGK